MPFGQDARAGVADSVAGVEELRTAGEEGVREHGRNKF